MKNKVLKITMIMLLIIAMTMSDFIFVGMNLITYALEDIDNSTSHNNVKFSVYFKAESDKKVAKTEYEINSTEMKLYMEIAVQNEGYFDGVIALENSNFKLKQEILSEGISKIEGNTITLNRVGAGDTVEIEVGIEPIVEETLGDDMLSKESTLKLSGSYKDSTEKDISIEADKKVALNLLVPVNIDTVLGGGVITNKIYKIGEENKRIVQIELNSAVVNNSYPIKSTTFELNLPEGVEKVEVISQGTYATNGELDKDLKDNYVLDTQNNKLKVTIKNESKQGKISWKKGIDSVVITLILDAEKSIDDTKYKVNAKVELYGVEGKTIEKEATYNLTQEADGIIRTTIENAEDIFKGKIYSREDREYNVVTNIEVNFENLIENATIQEKNVYKVDIDSEEKSANIQYKTTTISKAEFDKVLGDGKLLIKDQNGNVIKEITKDTQTDENGNIIIVYAEGVKELTIEISKAIETGIIRLNHTKVIKSESYTREEITNLKYLVEIANVTYNEKTYNYAFRKEFGETKTQVELTVVPQNLSTAVTNEQVKFAITLRSDNEKYDLFKNPTIKVKLPDYVKNIEFTKATPLYLENMQISSFLYLSDTKEIELKLTGEQTKYNGVNTNAYIEILTNIELDETIPNKQDVITLTYTNENAIAYENNGKVDVNVNITGHSGLIAFNSILDSNVKTNSITSEAEQVANLKMGVDATEKTFQITLLNNTGANLRDVKILGNLPVDGGVTVGNYTFKNTIGATLKSGINVHNSGAIVYYTQTRNATYDLQNKVNGWTTNLAELENPVLYMIVIPNMQIGTNFIANYTMNIPANLDYNKDLKTTYIVDYSLDNANNFAKYALRSSNANVEAVPVGLETGKINVTLEASVGGQALNNGDVVKTGEIIKYKITVTNSGSTDANNVEVKGLVPEGTVYLELVTEDEQGEDTAKHYKDDETKKKQIYTLDKLNAGESRTFQYEVRVKDNANNKLENQAIVNYNDNIEIESNVMESVVEIGDISIKIERFSTYSDNIKPGDAIEYLITVTNISNTNQDNIEVNIRKSDEFEIISINEFLDSDNEEDITKDITNLGIKISSLEVGKSKKFTAFYSVNNFAEASKQIEISAIAKCNNKTYYSNAYDETIYGLDVKLEWNVSRVGEYLKPGETIDYEITVTNNSIIEALEHYINMEIARQLTITKIEINGENKDISNENYVNIGIELQAKQTTKIKITAIVNYDPTRTSVETIESFVKLLYKGIETKKSDIVVHYLDSVIEQIPDDPIPDIPGDSDEEIKPDIPVNPEDPDEPINPDIPVIPDNPDEPDEPIDPDIPVNPDEPEGPIDPDIPVNPEYPDEPIEPDTPINPDDPDEPIEPDDPNEPDDPDNPDEPDNPVKPEEPKLNYYNISGKAWVDVNHDGEMNEGDTFLKGIKVKLLNVKTDGFVRNEKGTKDLIAETDKNGNYLFENVTEGNYIVVFEYDNSLYKPTTYEKNGIAESNNSNVISKVLTVNGEKKEYAITDEIKLNQDVSNLNMGLVFVKKFDIKLEKYISKLIVQTSTETLTYDYKNVDFAKVEIHKNRMIGSSIIVQYTIRVTNAGDVGAYISSIVDYIPEGLKFSSELNKNWYEANGNLYTNIFEGEQIAPGEIKEVNLILTKTKTDGNAELINNMAEINDAYNVYGIKDLDSTQANQNKEENDLGSADLMISIQTGTIFNYIIVVISMLGIIGIAVYVINKKVLFLNFNERR